jgi:antitoxin component YwqK of YwqJK toxin-antitoxin module/CHAT domain-containing protein/Flp pilus assembly protein TadD
MSMPRFFFAIFTVLIFFNATAQFPPSPNKLDEKGLRTGHWTLLYDSAFKRLVKDPDSVVYYRLAHFEGGKPIGKVRDFYRTGRKQWEGFLASYLPDVPGDGEAIYYHENGKVKETVTWKNGKLNGPARGYDIYGRLTSEGNYLNGEPHGLFVANYPDGKREYEVEMRNGKANGVYVEYYTNGIARLRETRKDGLTHGVSELRYENGNLNRRATFINGQKDGSWEWFNEQGILEQKGQYKNGLSVGFWTDYYEDGTTVMNIGHKDTLGAQGPWVYYHKNGLKQKEGIYVNDKSEGIWKYYHENGQLNETGMRSQGMLQGEWRAYYDDGALKIISSYENDSTTGLYKSFHRNGNVKAEGQYARDKKQGLWKYYNEDGSPESEETMINGVLNGPAKTYYANGQLTAELNYINEKKSGLCKWYHPNGRISGYGNYVEDLKHGTSENYYENGIKKDSGTWINGLETGYRKNWFDNGQLQSEGYYKEDKKEGEWKWYFPSGQLMDKYTYVNGKSEGPYENYHANGNKKHFGTNKNGERHGLTKHWYENGNLFEEVMRQNGLATGLSVRYDSLTGQKISEIYFLNGMYHGRWTKFENGKKISEGQYVNDKANGIFTYYKNGKKIRTETYYNGFYETVYNIRDSVEKLMDYKEYDKARACIVWAEKVLKKNKQENTIRAAVPLMLRQRLAYELKNQEEALAWNDKQIAVEIKYEGDTTNNYFVALSDRANILSSPTFKRYEEAAELYRKGMAHDLSKGNYLNHSVGVFNLAATLSKAGKVSAEEIFAQEIERMAQLNGAHHPATLEIKSMQGMYYHKFIEDYEKATLYYKQFIPELEAHAGNNKRLKELLANSISNMANDLENLLQRTEAIVWFKKSIAMAEKEGINNPLNYILGHQRLGWLYVSTRKLDSAHLYYDKLLAVLENSNLKNTLWYATTLHGKANLLFTEYRYEEAVKNWEQAKTLLEELNKTQTQDYANVLSGFQSVYDEWGNYDKAEQMAQLRLALIKNLYGEASKSYLEIYLELGDIYKDWDRYDKAAETLNKAEQQILNHLGPDSFLYASCQYSLAMLHYELNDYKNSIKYYDKAMPFYRANINDYPADCANMLGNQADNHKFLGNYAEAEKLINEAIGISEKYFSKESTDYLGKRSRLASLYNYQGLFSQAIPIYLNDMEAYKKLVGPDHIRYIESVRRVARCYYDQNEYKKAETYYLQFRDLAAKNPGEKSVEFIDANYKLASIYSETGLPLKAEPLMKKSIELAETYYGLEHPETAYYWKELGMFYGNYGPGSKAEEMFEKAANMMGASSVGTQSSLYGSYITLLAKVKSARSKNQEAESLLQHALKITYADRENNPERYTDAANAFGIFYQKMGRFRDAEAVLAEALKANEQYNHGNFYRQLMDSYIALNLNWGRYEKAAELAEKFLALLEEDLSPTNGWVTGTHNMLGLIYLDMNNVPEAEKHFKYCLEADKTIGYENSTSLHNWSTILVEKGDFEGAEKALLKSVEIQSKSKAQPDLKQASTLLDNQAQLYQAWGKLDKAEKIWLQVIQNLKRYTEENFYFMSDEEKAQFWNDVKPSFEYFNTFAVLRSKENPAILGEMYNNQLATKAILLSASNKIKNRILNSRDEGMISQYYHWIETREKLAQHYTLSAEALKEKKTEIDSLQTVSNRIEKDLNITAGDLEKDRQKKATTWRDVQKTLTPSEAAIEIIRFRYFDKHIRDSVLYAALVLTAETTNSPRLVVLPNGKYLENRGLRYYKNAITNRLEDKLSYDTYWAAIEPLIKGKTRVYLSLDGVYNQLNINTLSDASGRFLVDSRNFTVVSNTKDIVAMKSRKLSRNNQNTTAALFGFPKYFIGKDKLKQMAGEQKRDFDLTSIDERDATGINELPGTLKEIEQVKNILSASHWQAFGFTNESATEKALKTVSYPRILHIATHGFFVDEQNTSATFKLGTATEYAAQNPLLRSGILLSGAANFIQNNFKLDEENGILTAYEAANLNLENTDLAVLSACETGKGEVQNGEGVYGLQRAFQTAGAQAIIMSLWKVDDTATQELMTSFYQSWMGGSTKADAFRKAQLQIKNKYNHPYYWGAFVMMGE